MATGRRLAASLYSIWKLSGMIAASVSTHSGTMGSELMAPALVTGKRGRNPNFPPIFVSRSRKSGSSRISQSPRLVEALNSPLHQSPTVSRNCAAVARLVRSINASGTRPLRCSAHRTRSARLSLLPTVESSKRPRSTIVPPRKKMFQPVRQPSDPPANDAPASKVVKSW